MFEFGFHLNQKGKKKSHEFFCWQKSSSFAKDWGLSDMEIVRLFVDGLKAG